MSAPQINVKDVQDPILRRNFQNLKDYFEAQNQLRDFQFVELVFTEATSHQRIRHSLGVIPKDVLLSRLSGPGSVTFNLGLFTSDYIDVSTSGACRVRFFVGTQAVDGQEQENKTTDAVTYSGGA